MPAGRQEMRRYESPLSASVKGGLAGAVGTAFVTVALQRGPGLMKQAGLSEGPRPVPREQSAERTGEPTGKLAEKVAVGVLETPIEPEARETAGQAIHWGYGVAWGVLYGI